MSLQTTILAATAVVELCIWLAILRGISGFYRDDSGDWHARRAAIWAEDRQRRGRIVQTRAL